MAWTFRDSRHAVERELDLRIAEARTGRVVEASKRLDAVLTAAITEGKRVSKLGSIADRIAQKKVSHDAKADEWAARLDALDRREPGAFAIGDAVIEEREGDLADMERTMRSLSNLPNVGGDYEKG
jgi:hypothetical protein